MLVQPGKAEGQVKDDRMSKIPRRGMNGFAGEKAPHAAAEGPDSIAIGLQQLFAAIAEEPIPDEFMALLDRIDANERSRLDTQQPVPVASAKGGNGE